MVVAARPRTGYDVSPPRGGVAAKRRNAFVVVAPGLEAVAARELAALGISETAREAGGISCDVTDEQLFSANLHLRAASRVLARIAEFRATAFHELERLARAVPWEEFVAADGTVRLRVSCHKSRLYHSSGVAQRVAGAIQKRVPGVKLSTDVRDPDDDAAPTPEAQLFLVRLNHDVCTISADSSGELLHRRGYRLATAKAPIRETLAAASLLALGWTGDAPLVDPLCGAGTIAIEGALIARRIAPGLHRNFSCERWPAAHTAAFKRLREAAQERILPRAPSAIVGSDRDAGATTAARANAARAGVAPDIEFTTCALSRMDARARGPGLLLTNPPYGTRVGARRELRDLYAQLGNIARARLVGWTVALIATDRMLEAQVKLPFEEAIRFRNGGIPVHLVHAAVPESPAGERG